VWDEVTKLLRNPEEILRYFHEQHGKEVGTTFDLARRRLAELERSLAVLKREECRLVDAYQGQVIELEELRERRFAIDQRTKELHADVKRVEQELGRLQRQGSIREGIALLTKKLAGSLEELTFEEKQKIIQLLVKEIRVHAGHVGIHYIMPLSGNLQLQSRSLPVLPCQRIEEWGEWMREELVLDVPHRQVVFTIPRMFRIFFKYKRRLLGDLCRCALRTLSCYFAASAGSELTPGIIVVIQTFGARRAKRQRSPRMAPDEGLGR
jgi:hypothetical protein